MNKAFFVRIYSDYGKGWGAMVVSAKDKEEALQLAKDNHPYDILDIDAQDVEELFFDDIGVLSIVFHDI